MAMQFRKHVQQKGIASQGRMSLTSPAAETEGEAINLPIPLPLGQERDGIHIIQIVL